MFGKVTIVTEPEYEIEIDERQVALHYFNARHLPALINSPLREDRRPSFSIYSPAPGKVRYKDFATGDSGSIWSLLSRLWGLGYFECRKRVQEECSSAVRKIGECKRIYTSSKTTLKAKERKWMKHDYEYWKSYGIPIKALVKANVHPISHYFIEREGYTSVYKADDYAYAFLEFKEGKQSIKVYQPFSQRCKWRNSHDKSVISLWTLLPKKGKKVCICSSLKDALCLWNNARIPSIAIQGEGYSLSETVINDLRERFESVFICLDNDKAGIAYSRSLAKRTGFTNIILPYREKDISDYYKSLKDKRKFNNIKVLFYDNTKSRINSRDLGMHQDS